MEGKEERNELTPTRKTGGKRQGKERKNKDKDKE